MLREWLKFGHRTMTPCSLRNHTCILGIWVQSVLHTNLVQWEEVIHHIQCRVQHRHCQRRHLKPTTAHLCTATLVVQLMVEQVVDTAMQLTVQVEVLPSILAILQLVWCLLIRVRPTHLLHPTTVRPTLQFSTILIRTSMVRTPREVYQHTPCPMLAAQVVVQLSTQAHPRQVVQIPVTLPMVDRARTLQAPPMLWQSIVKQVQPHRLALVLQLEQRMIQKLEQRILTHLKAMVTISESQVKLRSLFKSNLH